MVTWVDGRLVAPGDAAVRADDHGVTVGDGVFETLKVVQGRPFALTRHLARLARSAHGLGITAPDDALVRDGIDAVLGAGDPLPFGRLRITVTSGPGPLGSGRGDTPPTVVVHAQEAALPQATAAVHVVPWRRNERSAVAGLKTTSYAENAVALARAAEQGASEALLLNTRDELCEGTGSNVVLVHDGVARTPGLDSGCLAGITRELLLEWAAEEGADAVQEAVLTAEDLAAADEVLLLSSTRDVQPVHAVDGRALAAPGPVGRRLADLFARRAADRLDP
ncbi:aminotransferase class IV [Angustibacter aerolatus]